MSGDASKVPPERLLRMQAACARRDDPSSGRTDGRTDGRAPRSDGRSPPPPRSLRARRSHHPPPWRARRGGVGLQLASAQTSDRVTAPAGGGDRAVSTGIAAAQRCSAAVLQCWWHVHRPQ